MNVADSEVVASVMQMAGYETTENLDEAHAVFLNTCSVRDNAEQKIYHRLEALAAIRRKRPLIIGVLGCMATEHLLLLPTTMPSIEVISIVIILLRFFKVCPIEHMHILSIATDEEHRQRSGIIFLDDAIDNNSNRVCTISRYRLTLVLTTDHHGHHADDRKH